MQSPGERADNGWTAARGTGSARNHYLRSDCGHDAVLRKIRCGCGGATLELFRCDVAGRDLADGIHHRREGQAESVLRQRNSLDRNDGTSNGHLHSLLRFERRRDSLFWFLYLSRFSDVSICTHAEWISLVVGEHQDGRGFLSAGWSRVYRTPRAAFRRSYGARWIGLGIQLHLRRANAG